MSPCEKYQELISRMIDGELSAREEADLAEHIDVCPECAALFAAFSALSQQLGADLEEPPRDLRENVMAEIRREEIRKKNRIPTVFRIVMSAAAMVAVVFGVYLGVSLTKNASLSAAAYQEAPKVEAQAVRTADAAVAEEAEWEEAVQAQEPAALPRMESAAEEPAPAAGLAANDAPAAVEEAEGDLDDDEAPAEEKEAEAPTWDFSHWDLSLFRELLGGEESDLTRQELEPALIGCALVRSGSELAEFRLYVWADDLYYYDPVRDAVFQAELSPAQWEAFLG